MAVTEPEASMGSTADDRAESGDVDVVEEVTGAPKPGRVGWGVRISVIWLILVLFVSFASNYLGFVDEPGAFSRNRLEGPSADHWFGTDDNGRDVFARVVHGGRISLSIALISIAVGLVVGGFLGLVSGYFGGVTDRVVVGGLDLLLAFPPLVLLLFIVSVRGQDFFNITVAVSILSVPATARIARANTLVYAQREFVTAARTLGAKNRRILVREVLPNVVPTMVSFSLLGVAIIIVAEGALAFLGLSVKSPTVTWGGIINQGRGFLEEAPHIVLSASAVMFLTLLALNVIGDALRRRFDVREAGI